jgi:hypothetical protein
MKHAKVAHRPARPADAVQQGLLVGLTLMAILVPGAAMARRGNAELPPGVQLAPVTRPAAHVAAVRPAPQAAALRPDDTKPIQRHGRHAYKPRAGTSRSGAH